MALSLPYPNISSGATIIAGEHKANYAAIATHVNGNLDTTSLKANAGIVDTQLAQIVTPGKIAATALPSGVGVGYTVTFDNADLSTGVLTVVHSLDSEYVTTTVYDNNGKVIWADEITNVDADTCTVDLTSFGVLTGDWNVRVTA